MQLEGIQVTHGMSQKFEFEICQNLVHTLEWCCGSELEEYIMCTKMCQPTTWQVHTGPPELSQPVWQGCPLN